VDAVRPTVRAEFAVVVQDERGTADVPGVECVDRGGAGQDAVEQPEVS
jgi:hypothetical protein